MGDVYLLVVGWVEQDVHMWCGHSGAPTTPHPYVYFATWSGVLHTVIVVECARLGVL